MHGSELTGKKGKKIFVSEETKKITFALNVSNELWLKHISAMMYSLCKG